MARSKQESDFGRLDYVVVATQQFISMEKDLGPSAGWTGPHALLVLCSHDSRNVSASTIVSKQDVIQKGVAFQQYLCHTQP